MNFRLLAAALLCLAAAQTGFVATAVAADGHSAGTSHSAAKKAALKHGTAKHKKVSRRLHHATPESALAMDAHGNPLLRSAAFYVTNEETGEVLLEKNSHAVLPIASITKLMTAMVALDARPDLAETLTVTTDDIDTLKGTSSRLVVGTQLTREEMLNLALMSSENRAASALARNYPGGRPAFVAAMNAKARLLDMKDTHFYDSNGLNPANVSSPRDLARLVRAAASYPLIRRFSTTDERYVDIRGRQTRFGNTNSLVRSPDWDIAVSKTGYITEAGRCLVMQAKLLQQKVVIVLMDSVGRYTRTADAKRVKQWLEAVGTKRLAKTADEHES